MGGAAYVNIYYLLLNSGIILENEKELSINLCAIFIDIGKIFKN